MELRLPASAAVVAALLTIAFGAGPAEADYRAQTYTFEVPFTVGACPPYESIDFVARIRFVTKEYEGFGHYIEHVTIQSRGVSASGVEYIATGIENTSAQGFNVFHDEGTQTYIAKGEPSATDDFFAHEVLHVTVNANGEPTAEFWSERLECQ